MKKNLSTRIKRSLSRIKALYIFITDVYLTHIAVTRYVTP